MAFDIELQPGIAASTLRRAGLDVTEFIDRVIVADVRPALPLTLWLPCFASDRPMHADVTVLALNPNVHLRISLPDPATEQVIADYARRYSAENDGQALARRESDLLWQRIEAVLARHGRSSAVLRTHPLDQAAVTDLLGLADDVSPLDRSTLANVFVNGYVVGNQKARVARWLLDLFEVTRDNFERAQIGLRVDENMVPDLGDRVLALVMRKELSDSRVGLLMALARSRHPQAADTIASVLHENHLALTGIELLGKLKAVQHADAIRRFLHHSEPDVRRQARKALAKLGFPPDKPPKPVHVVPNRTVPSDLPEHSAALEMNELESRLLTLSASIENGFREPEVAEVMGVVERMKVDATRSFRFDVVVQSRPAVLWLSIFLDDVDSPDVTLRGPESVIEVFRSATEG